MDKLELTTIQNIAIEFCEELKAKLKANGSIASGDLSNSIKGIVKQNGKYVVISISLEDYWKYVEYGTKPHWPPVDAIKKWISVKPILPRPLKSGKLPTTDQLAYLIGRKISKTGTKAKPFLKPTLSSFDLVGKVYDEVKKLINKEIEEDLEL
jgi:hypothetical protein